ncbi:MAG TPA: carboxypeptidase-like regulatory domain-containing protein, partial [Longimicrobium sp.]|nr:carboxypeptidase-like regulatory domain-containing protein [Longimicrobium sp.]
RSGWVAAMGPLAVVGVVSCLPIPYTRNLSSPIAGRYLHADGTPVQGARVVLSITPSDSVCVNPVASGTSDAQGRFVIPRVQQRERYLFLVGDAATCYRLCAGMPQPVQASYSCGIMRDPVPRPVSCVSDREVSFDSLRVTCRERPHA